jgi:hypothetical protein
MTSFTWKIQRFKSVITGHAILHSDNMTVIRKVVTSDSNDNHCFVVIIIISYHMFAYLWYFSSWTNGATPHSGFKFQTVAFSLLFALSLVQLIFFVENLLNAVLVFLRDN